MLGAENRVCCLQGNLEAACMHAHCAPGTRCDLLWSSTAEAAARAADNGPGSRAGHEYPIWHCHQVWRGSAGNAHRWRFRALPGDQPHGAHVLQADAARLGRAARARRHVLRGQAGGCAQLGLRE